MAADLLQMEPNLPQAPSRGRGPGGLFVERLVRRRAEDRAIPDMDLIKTGETGAARGSPRAVAISIGASRLRKNGPAAPASHSSPEVRHTASPPAPLYLFENTSRNIKLRA